MQNSFTADGGSGGGGGPTKAYNLSAILQHAGPPTLLAPGQPRLNKNPRDQHPID
jgi:hypothetical protein